MAHAEGPDTRGGTIEVDVAVGVAPRDVRVQRLRVPVGSTVRDALRASGWLNQLSDLSEDTLASGQWSVGVWGRRERPGHVLRERDRIEVVRGLLVDPKEARRVRYRAQGEKLPRGIHRPPSGVPRQRG
ncbi:MAG: RnfH family protein [Proteobacteria bacterium]|uniref:RnfH family protein n=1 Tax=Aquabacterium sp. TaxID=1872578 RepID=UPI0035C67992|nr:RnfH family protein [Pseudomonadota bacterium]